ncbi:MAG: archease [Thermocladium sp.]|jgi:SHS2 domain-containing protein|nr:MAG: archease [Thermocladium sp. ECH_B]
MMIEPPFEYADHTADIMIIARGKSLGEAFKNAALGVLNLMYDTSKVRTAYSHRVELSGIDLEQLLFNWIDEVIYQFDGAKMAIGNDIDIDVDERTISLKAEFKGENYDPAKHGFRGTIVKAITYHLMKIEKDNEYRIQFVVDI